MNADKSKGRKFELPVDLNGVGVQVWTLGGETIKVTNGNTFTCLSSLIRIFNSSSNVLFIKKVGLVGDEGVPIGAKQAETFGCVVGEVYTMVGEGYVSFFKNRG